MKHPLVRIDYDDDPERCQGVDSKGQCIYKRMPESEYCPRHGGNKAGEAKKKEAAHEYRLQTWQNRINEFAEGDHVKGLRGEIGILRMVLEEILNQAKTPKDLLMNSSSISDLCAKIEKLVNSCDRLERNMGLMLDKAAALNFANQIVQVITEYIQDAEIVDSISNGIIDALKGLTDAPGNSRTP